MQLEWNPDPDCNIMGNVPEHYAKDAKIFFYGKKGPVSEEEVMKLFEEFEMKYFSEVPPAVRVTTDLLADKNARIMYLLTTFTK